MQAGCIHFRIANQKVLKWEVEYWAANHHAGIPKLHLKMDNNGRKPSLQNAFEQERI